MKHIKYSNKAVMYLISAGYLVLIITALFLNLNIMYLLAPYALLTFWCINYTHKRSENFVNYWIGFELGLNEKGNFFKFYILASKSRAEIHMILVNEIEILKTSQYQTGHILDVKNLQTTMADLKYLICLPSSDPQIVMRAGDFMPYKNTDISSSHYEEILFEYNIFKSTIINVFKQNKAKFLQVAKQPNFGWKLRNRTPSILRRQS